MRIIYVYVLVFLPALVVQAQTNTGEDSIRTVVLQEVRVSAQQKNQQQQLYQFFRSNQAATTEDVLSRLPELSLIRRGSYGMEPVIRSYNSGQVNLLLDGMRIHGACTDKMDPASIYIEPVNLSSIEVRTNGSSFLNGSSVGGSINMKLAEVACHDEPVFSGSLQTGYHTAAKAFYRSLNLNYASGKWGFKATGTYRKSQNYRDGSGKTVPFSQYEKANYSLHAKRMVGQDMYVKIDLLADDGWNIGYAALPMDVGYAKARIGAISLVKEKGRNGWGKMEAKLYANKVQHSMDDTHRPDVPMHMDMPGESVTSGMYVQTEKYIGQRQQLTFRADASVTSLHASMTMYQPGQSPMYMLTWPDNRQFQSGMAIQYTLRIDSSSQLQVHGRADRSSFGLTSQMGKDQLAVFGYAGQHSSFFIPSFSVQYSRKLDQHFKASASIGVNGRTPTASELFGFYLFNQFDGYDYIGNTRLQQERGQQAELTLSWQPAKLNLQVTGYLSRIEQYIVGKYVPTLSTMTIGAKGVKMYENIPHALLAGVEGSVVYKPSSNTILMATVKYAYGKDNTGAALPLMAPLRNIGSIKQYLGKLWLQAEMETAAAQNRVSLVAKERTTGAFSLYHFRLGYQTRGMGLQWQLNAGVENIFDSFYREHLDWGNIARPGRNLYLQVGIGF
ncbi:MAG TPA: TonB-dependent receptor [Sediminibacterium sp.]